MYLAVLSFPRTGTHLIETALNKHPDIFCAFEPFNENISGHTETSAREVLETIRAGTSKPNIAIPLHWEHARIKWQDIWDIILEEEWPIIAVNRINLLEQYTSLMLAHKTSVWMVTNSKNLSYSTVELHQISMMEYFLNMEKQLIDRDIWLESKTWHHLRVTYKSCAFMNGLDMIQRYLNVELHNIKPDTVKQGRPLKDVIENWHQVQEWLIGTKWESFLTKQVNVLM